MQIDSSSQKSKSKNSFHFTRSARIDFTPMVDLGFLLITFFVYTSQISNPAAMKLAVPKDDTLNATPVKCSASFTILILKNGKIGWYDCKDGKPSAVQHTSLQGDEGLRKLLLQKQQQVRNTFGNIHDLVAIIKPFKDSDYRTLIDVLDEMKINDITRYALVEPEESDLARVSD